MERPGRACSALIQRHHGTANNDSIFQPLYLAYATLQLGGVTSDAIKSPVP